jgi:hypothetical protein
MAAITDSADGWDGAVGSALSAPNDGGSQTASKQPDGMLESASIVAFAVSGDDSRFQIKDFVSNAGFRTIRV